MTYKDKIKKVLPEYHSTFTAVDIAQRIGVKVSCPNNYDTAPYITKLLKELCKEGFLYQWVKGVEYKNDLSDSAPNWNMNYIRQDSPRGKELKERRGVNGYRIQ